MDAVDCLVVGAGVVGLATAKALAEAGREVVVAERESLIGSGISSRNSEVVHAGLYYAPGSLKATLCVEGRRRLYAYCQARGVPHRRCGKLIVATREEDRGWFEAIVARAAACGVTLEALDRDAASTLEPELQCAAALWSPDTGIVDSHAFMNALLGDAERAGAVLALHSPFVEARRDGDGWIVATGGAEGFELRCTWLVNGAGLFAQDVASRMHGFPAQAIPRLRLAKGHYFSLRPRAPFTHLVYPTPSDGGLGTHLTLDLGGAARFGPDVEWLPENADPAKIDYAVDPSRATAFASDIRRYWPGLPDDALMPAYTGVRPKLSGPGEPAADFRVDGPEAHGVPGTVQLFGIESPGLTSSLAIAARVARLVTGDAGRAAL